MQTVTADEVKDAMISKGITRVDHHGCGGCGAMVHYFRVEDQLYFDPSCNYSSLSTPPQPRSWQSAADWINMQSKPEIKQRLAALFGITNTETT